MVGLGAIVGGYGGTLGMPGGILDEIFNGLGAVRGYERVNCGHARGVIET